MSVENTLKALSDYCVNSSGDTQVWNGKSGTYHWNLGREVLPGEIVNGVVRKLISNDNDEKVWIVAGSFKIDPTGDILRFTGLPRKTQKTLQSFKAVDKIREEI
jgi:hypothetical protein